MLYNIEDYNQYSAKLIAYINLCDLVAETKLGNRQQAAWRSAIMNLRQSVSTSE